MPMLSRKGLRSLQELAEGRHPEANIVSVDYDPGASETNQLNRIKLMVATAHTHHRPQPETELPQSTLRPARHVSVEPHTSRSRPATTAPISPADTWEETQLANH